MILSARSESIRTLISPFHMYENDFAREASNAVLREEGERKKPKLFGNATSDNKYFCATRLCNLKRGQPFLSASVSLTLKEIMITSVLSTFVTQHRVSLHYYSFELLSKKQKKTKEKRKEKKIKQTILEIIVFSDQQNQHIFRTKSACIFSPELDMQMALDRNEVRRDEFNSLG